MKHRVLILLIVTISLFVIPVWAEESDGESTIVSYAVEGGTIQFDTSAGMIVGCDKTVTKLNIPSEIDGVLVTTLAGLVFIELPELTEVYIPETVTTCYGSHPVNSSIFSGCQKLEKITVDEENPIFCSEDGVLYSKNMGALLQYPPADSRTSFTVPESVTYINTSALTGASHLTELILPKGLKEIDDGGITDCHNIKSIVIPEGMTYLGMAAFFQCSGLETVTIPGDMKTIMPQTFNGCDSLKEVIYDGTRWQWEQIEIGAQNEPLLAATIMPLQENLSEAFADLSADAWYMEAVENALKKGYFNGISETRFAPEESMTRAMFVTVLSRMEGIDVAKYSGSDFSDVPEGQWYTSAVKWASENHIVEGVGSGRFDPNGKVTREQMASILYRYGQYRGERPELNAYALDGYKDKSEVSTWAEAAMKWAVGEKILKGFESHEIWGVLTFYLRPQETATRAQVAQIILNYQSN